MRNFNIAVIGLGYVGLPLAVEFGKRLPTKGFDINESRVTQLGKGIDNTFEVSKADLDCASELIYCSDLEQIRECNVYIITVPTPVDDVNRPDLTPIVKATEMIGSVLDVGDIVIYESTVYPGCTEEICVPILENKSSLIFNEDFFCGYSPERINPGDKVNSLTKIKKITSGSNIATANIIDDLYKIIITAGTFKASSIKVAEAAKVIENTQRDLNIALVNELSVIFGRLNIDTLEVLEAAGSKWNFLPFRPGLVGGHCIGVDPYYLTHKAEQVGYHPQVILAGRRINDGMAAYLVKKVVQKMILTGIDIPNSTVGILGVTFKENCPDVRNSKMFDVIREFMSWGLKVLVMDPWANPEEVREYYNIELDTIDQVRQVDTLVVGVGHDEFRELTPVELRSFCRSSHPVLADVKSIYDRDACSAQGFSVFRL